MEKTTNKKKQVNIVRIMLYISAALILASVCVSFLPVVHYTDPYTKLTTSFTGLDFTKALYMPEYGTKMSAVKSLLESGKAGVVAETLAILCPVCLGYSVIMFLLTLLATYYKKLNNIFIIGGFFGVWTFYLMTTINVVGRMAVVKGENILNNYAIGAAVPLGTICVLAASIINIFMVFVEEAKSKPQQKKPSFIPPPPRRY